MTFTQKPTKVAIIGAGPAGIYCALHLQDTNNISIDIYEKSKPLKTLLPTGGGRCNLAHYAPNPKSLAKNYPRGEKFLYSIFTRHFVNDTLVFFKSIGIETYMQEDERYFPISNSARDMREKMLCALKNKNIINKNITDIKQLNNYDFVVIATGSRGGYSLAEQLGHTIIPPKPSLCGLKLAPGSPKYPQGVTINTPEGEILFTKDGLTGPYIYKISSLKARDNFPYDITIPLISREELQNKIKCNPKKIFGNIVSEFIPKSLSRVILGENYNIKCSNVKKTTLDTLETLTFHVISPDNKGEIVTSGGVELNEINNFCGSKLNPKIYFCGEIMNIDGFCGGYNLQNCWSSAFCAAQGIKNHLTQRKNL